MELNLPGRLRVNFGSEMGSPADNELMGSTWRPWLVLLVVMLQLLNSIDMY